MEGHGAVCLVFILTAGTFIHSTKGMNLREFAEKFPGTNVESCYNRPETCPRNMVRGTCICQLATCEEPEGLVGCHTHCPQESEGCTCPEGFMMRGDDCLFPDECPCYWPEVDMVIPEGKSYVSPSCDKRCSCVNGKLVCEDSFQCSPHGSCEESNNRWTCSCKEGYEGDGIQCTATSTDCQDIFMNGGNTSGLYSIAPAWSQDPFQVYCNMADGGGWTVIQRQNGSGDFYRYWDEYKNGFGDLEGSMWLGNDKIHNLTTQTSYELRIDLTDRDGIRYYATYSSFRINNETDKYRLASVGGYDGNAGSDYSQWHVNKQFSTRDQDNDGSSNYDCANLHQGGWWFRQYTVEWQYCSNVEHHEHYCDIIITAGIDCGSCALYYLNGNIGNRSAGRSVYWKDLDGYDCGLQYTEMKLRPVRK